MPGGIPSEVIFLGVGIGALLIILMLFGGGSGKKKR